MSLKTRREVAYWFMLLICIGIMLIQFYRYATNTLSYTTAEMIMNVISVAFMIFPKFILNMSEKGMTGIYDYSSNITDLDYTQKKYVDERGSVFNATTATLSASDLNTAYPNAKDGFSVIAPNVVGGGKLYIKAGAGWVYQQILAVV